MDIDIHSGSHPSAGGPFRSGPVPCARHWHRAAHIEPSGCDRPAQPERGPAGKASL